MSGGTWEEAVRWYRAQPGNEAAVRDNYFDLPVRAAAERYAAGEEFAEVARLLGPGDGRQALDLGAGNGIASYALACGGWRVTALEPDPSDEVGAGAIRALGAETGLPIEVVRDWGEKLPFADARFDAVHGRQVLHHAADLDRMAAEVHRVLAPGGTALFTREHVVDDAAQLQAFLDQHPLQHHYGGEHAFALSRYLEAFGRAGLRVRDVWGPFDSILNFYPGTEAGRRAALRRSAMRRGFGLGTLLLAFPGFLAGHAAWLRSHVRPPGRLFSFLLEKPCAS